MGILNEYEEMLVGYRENISASYFLFDKKGNERIAVSVIRYAIEELLGWDKQSAIQMFNSKYIAFMKLEPLMKYIAFPSDVKKDDTEYILYLLYPKQVNYNIQKYTIRVYESVLQNKARYPKDYMYGFLGMLRAKICLQYSINQDKVFKSADDLYRFFASKEAVRYLKKKKLYQLYNSFYNTPLEYCHDSMPSSVKNEFLYHNYIFMQKYEMIADKKER